MFLVAVCVCVRRISVVVVVSQRVIAFPNSPSVPSAWLHVVVGGPLVMPSVNRNRRGRVPMSQPGVTPWPLCSEAPVNQSTRLGHPGPTDGSERRPSPIRMRDASLNRSRNLSRLAGRERERAAWGRTTRVFLVHHLLGSQRGQLKPPTTTTTTCVCALLASRAHKITT